MFKWLATVGLLVVCAGASAQISVVPNAKLKNGEPALNYTPNPLGSNADVTVTGEHKWTATSAGQMLRPAGFLWTGSCWYNAVVGAGGTSVSVSGSRSYARFTVVNDIVEVNTSGFYSIPPGEYFGKAKSTYDAHMDGSGSHTATFQFFVQPYG